MVEKAIIIASILALTAAGIIHSRSPYVEDPCFSAEKGEAGDVGCPEISVTWQPPKVTRQEICERWLKPELRYKCEGELRGYPCCEVLLNEDNP